jgi:hypothetical protein
MNFHTITSNIIKPQITFANIMGNFNQENVKLGKAQKLSAITGIEIHQNKAAPKDGICESSNMDLASGG